MTTLSLPDAPVAAWLEAGRARSSRRSFDGTRISEPVLDELEAFVHSNHPSAVARTVVLRTAPERVFTGIVGAYGRVTGSPSALAFVGVAGAPGTDECVGYTGEAAVLEAARLGLDTCWIGGTFSAGKMARAVGLEAGERVFGVSPLGHATGTLSLAEKTIFGHKTTGPKPRKSAEEIAPGSGVWPGWARAAVEAARLAPSAMNRQPWRFSYADGRVTVSYEGEDAYKRVSKRLDCGIAMVHFEIGARHAGVAGRWELSEHGRDVATWVLG